MPEGSKRDSCEVLKVFRGSGQVARMDGGGGVIFILCLAKGCSLALEM